MRGTSHIGANSPSQVKVFLRADSAEMLVRLQLYANARLMGRAEFTDIQYVDGFWYAWFLVDADRYARELKDINGAFAGPTRPRAG